MANHTDIVEFSTMTQSRPGKWAAVARFFSVLLAVAVTGCAGASAPMGNPVPASAAPAMAEPPGKARASSPGVLHTVRSGSVTAHFRGERPAGGFPPEFGVSALWFSFAGDPARYTFTPAGELYFSDWRFDIFSPDGEYVLLLQGHYGPYHIVSVRRLKGYLAGKAGPDHIVGKSPRSGDPAAVHGGGRWTSAREVQLTVTCCGTSETVTFQLP